MRLLEGHDADVAEFVARLAPIERPVWETGFRAFGVIRDDGALVAGGGCNVQNFELVAERGGIL